MPTTDIINLTERGKTIISTEKHQAWEAFIQSIGISFFSIEDLKNTLNIMETIENSDSIDEAIILLKNSNYNEDTINIIRKIILYFSSKGLEFYKNSANIYNVSNFKR